jgi:hypothetical protein
MTTRAEPDLPTEQEVEQLKEQRPNLFPGDRCISLWRTLSAVEHDDWTAAEKDHLEGCSFCRRTRAGIEKKLRKRHKRSLLRIDGSARAEVICYTVAGDLSCSDTSGRFTLGTNPSLTGHIEIVRRPAGEGRVVIDLRDNPDLRGLAGRERIEQLSGSTLQFVFTHRRNLAPPRTVRTCLLITGDADLVLVSPPGLSLEGITSLEDYSIEVSWSPAPGRQARADSRSHPRTRKRRD